MTSKQRRIKLPWPDTGRHREHVRWGHGSLGAWCVRDRRKIENPESRIRTLVASAAGNRLCHCARAAFETRARLSETPRDQRARSSSRSVRERSGSVSGAAARARRSRAQSGAHDAQKRSARCPKAERTMPKSGAHDAQKRARTNEWRAASSFVIVKAVCGRVGAPRSRAASHPSLSPRCVSADLL
jgi:hypothetical protein